MNRFILLVDFINLFIFNSYSEYKTFNYCTCELKFSKFNNFEIFHVAQIIIVIDKETRET